MPFCLDAFFMIKYLGSKRLLIPSILDAVRAAPGARTVLDLFSGTSRVGHALKNAGYRVIANDNAAYAHALARCYVQADRPRIIAPARRLVSEFNRTRGRSGGGYFTETFCIRSRFFQPFNGERIDAIREAIVSKGLPPDLEAVMLVSLMEAADRVDSTTGVQMAYLKEWAPRSFNRLELRIPDVLPRGFHGRSVAHRLDAFEAAADFEADVAYIDPPYNQHSYLGNYHIWETLVAWDKPPVYGVACKRLDVRERRSIFNSRPGFGAAFERLLGAVRAPVLIVSFSNEGYLSLDALESVLGRLWDGAARVVRLDHDYRRYVGARIGIYNPRGERVGRVSHLTNREHIYIAAAPGARIDLDRQGGTALPARVAAVA